MQLNNVSKLIMTVYSYNLINIYSGSGILKLFRYSSVTKLHIVIYKTIDFPLLVKYTRQIDTIYIYGIQINRYIHIQEQLYTNIYKFVTHTTSQNQFTYSSYSHFHSQWISLPISMPLTHRIVWNVKVDSILTALD